MRRRGADASLNKFRIFETDEFRRSLKRIDRRTSERVDATIKKRVYPQLCAQPFAGPSIKKLRDYKPDTWRYRIGDFRLFYTIDASEHTVYILAIENRGSAYK